MPPIKGRYNSLTIAKKMELLREVDSNTRSKSAIAKKYGIAKSSVSFILKNRRKIEEIFNNYKSHRNRQRITPAKYRYLESKLYRFLKQLHNWKIPLTSAVVRKTAIVLAEKLNVEHFKASKVWFKRFKQRYDISLYEISKNDYAEVQEIQLDDEDFPTNPDSPSGLDKYITSEIDENDDSDDQPSPSQMPAYDYLMQMGFDEDSDGDFNDLKTKYNENLDGSDMDGTIIVVLKSDDIKNSISDNVVNFGKEVREKSINMLKMAFNNVDEDVIPPNEITVNDALKVLEQRISEMPNTPSNIVSNFNAVKEYLINSVSDT